MPHRLLLRLLDEDDQQAYGNVPTTSAGIGIKSFEDELAELSAFLLSDARPNGALGAGTFPQEAVARQPSFADPGPSSAPAGDADPRPVVALGMHRGPLRCLETFHPENCKKCVPAPSPDQYADWELRGDPGQKNGEKKMRSYLMATPEWKSKEARLALADIVESHEGMDTLAAALRGKVPAMLRKRHMLHMCAYWGYKYSWWRQKAQKAPGQPESTPPFVAAGFAPAPAEPPRPFARPPAPVYANNPSSSSGASLDRRTPPVGVPVAYCGYQNGGGAAPVPPPPQPQPPRASQNGSGSSTPVAMPPVPPPAEPSHAAAVGVPPEYLMTGSVGGAESYLSVLLKPLLDEAIAAFAPENTRAFLAKNPSLATPTRARDFGVGVRIFTQIASDTTGALQQCDQWVAELSSGSAEAVVAWRWLFGRMESTTAVVERIHHWMNVAATVNRRTKALKEKADSDSAASGFFADEAPAAAPPPAAPHDLWFSNDFGAYLKVEEFCQRALHALTAARFNGALQYVTTSRAVLNLLRSFCEEFTLRLRLRVKFIMDALQGRSLDGVDYWDRELVDQEWFQLAEREGMAAAETREMEGAMQKLRDAGHAAGPAGMLVA